MKRTFCIILIFYSLFAIAEDNQTKIDSLRLKLENSQGKNYLTTAIELSNELWLEDPQTSKSLLDEVISKSKENNYQLILAKAYTLKGVKAYEENKVLSGITYFQKAFNIYNEKQLATKSINDLIGIANGLTRIKKNNESIDTLNYIIHQYKDSLPQDEKANILHLISSNYYALGKNSLAIQYLDSSVNIEKYLDLKEDLANSYNDIGIIYEATGDYKNAIYYWEKSEALVKELQDTLMISYITYNKALIYYRWGVYDEALDLFLKSKNLELKMGKLEDLPSSYASIAMIYHEYKDFNKAKEYYLKSIELAEKFNDREIKSISLHNFGTMMIENERYDTALILLNQSLQIEMESQNTLGIAQSKSVIATVYSKLNKYPLAFEYYKEAEQVFKKFGSKSDLADLYIEMGNTHSQLHNDSLSVLYFNKGLKLSKSIKDIPTLLDAYKESSANFESIGDFEKALANYKKYKELNDSVFNDKASKRIDYLGLRFDKQEKEKQLEKLENEKKLLKAQQSSKNIQLIAAIAFSLLILIFFSIIYIFIKKSEKRIKQQYQVLLESEQKVKALLDASFDSTLLVDKQGIVRAANNNNLSGFLPDAQSIINTPILSLFETTNQKVLGKYIELVYSSKLFKELRIHDKNHIILNLKISPVQKLSGEVISLAFYIQDITQFEIDKQEKKKMEEQLIHTQKMETVGTLAGGIAHDFNNYLATIKGYVSMSLDDTEEGSTLHNYLSKTLKAVNLSQDTVKKLLTFSRSKDMEFNKFKLSDLMNDSIDIVKGAKPKSAEFLYKVPDSHIELLGEKNQLTQVLLNLCTNAFHAIEAIKNGKVELYAEEPKIIQELNNKIFICIKVKDNGIGMKKETQERIFEPFYTTKDVGKGTGLGLSMVSGIIKQHGGKIEVQSEFGKGSEFSLYLPIIS